jgi:hypothetical protein
MCPQHLWAVVFDLHGPRARKSTPYLNPRYEAPNLFDLRG